jgi:carboxyl-terminal processing protease
MPPSRTAERNLFAVCVAALAVSTGLGVYWERRDAGSLGARASEQVVKDAFAEGLDIVAANYAGPYEIDDVNEHAIQGMLRTLDPHSTFFDSREFAELRNEQQSQLIGIGVSISSRNGRTYIISAVPGTPADKAGLRYGDVIVAVDGKPTTSLHSAQVVNSVRGELGTPVEITVERLGAPAPLTFKIVREAVPIPSIRNVFMIDDKVGYIGMVSGFTSTTDAELGRAIETLRGQGMQHLVLDMRHNPGGLLEEAVKVAQRFLPAGQTILAVKGREGGTRGERVYTSRNGNPETMPLVVLIDASTASASEVVTGALQDHDRALVIGEPSFGKGIVQTVIELNYDTGLTLTTAKYVTPTGRSIQRDYSKISSYEYYYRRNNSGDDAVESEAVLTDSGRQVYGGGGITPDIRVAAPTNQRLRVHVVDAVFEFTRRVIAGQVASLREYRLDAVDYRHVLRGDEYRVTDRMLAAFREFVSQGDYQLTTAQIDANIDYVRNRLREELVTAAYGAEAGNQIYIVSDPVTLRAVESFPQARQLAENARAVRDRH